MFDLLWMLANRLSKSREVPASKGPKDDPFETIRQATESISEHFAKLESDFGRLDKIELLPIALPPSRRRVRNPSTKIPLPGQEKKSAAVPLSEIRVDPAARELSNSQPKQARKASPRFLPHNLGELKRQRVKTSQDVASQPIDKEPTQVDLPKKNESTKKIAKGRSSPSPRPNTLKTPPESGESHAPPAPKNLNPKGKPAI